MRTQEQIDKQIAGLKADRERLPEYSGFGDPNWACIDAQLNILDGSQDLDEFEEGDWEEMDEENKIYRAAEEAQEWLDGDRDEDLFSEE